MSMFSQVSMIQKVILATAIIVVGVTLYINRDDIKNILTEVCYTTINIRDHQWKELKILNHKNNNSQLKEQENN